MTRVGTTPLMRALDRAYRPLLARAVSPAGRWVAAGWRRRVLGDCSRCGSFTRLGAEFLPRLDEGSLVIEVQRDPAVSLDQSVCDGNCHGTARSCARCPRSPMRLRGSARPTSPRTRKAPNQNDIYLSYKPRRGVAAQPQRPSHHQRRAVADAVVAAIETGTCPARTLTTNQPIAVRFGELLEGVHADVAVKVFGP